MTMTEALIGLAIYALAAMVVGWLIGTHFEKRRSSKAAS